MRHITLSLIIFFLVASNVYATAQYPEILLFKGKEYFIHTNPLKSYFNDERKEPEGLFMPICSANWRGYIGTWKIENDNLYLIKIVEGTCDENPPEISLNKIFPNQNPPIKASWFSGTLIIPQGEEVNYVYMGYGSTYERYMFSTVSKGKIKRILKLNLDEFKKYRQAQFEEYKKTDEYRNKLKKLKQSEKSSEDFLNDFLFQYDSEYYLSLDFSIKE